MNDNDTETASDSDFASLGAHPSIVTALTGKGYVIPTPVQQRVLEADDRDLIVSAQTGSGKTIGFGLVVAKKLLGDAERVTPSKMPRALIITPTRELAAQVQRELAWLFASTGAKVVAFTGGTDVRGDSRSIMRGVDIAVGTPGRLQDLLDRRSLDFTNVEVVVLDEADEMLDMGFREAIEAIIKSTPDDRRTLLFSATLPPEIRALAKKFQTDAQAIDARANKVAGQSGHDDITYEAHLCRDNERIAVLVNVLRMVEEEGRTLVFCRTREAVGEMHRELASRGFLAAAISGDRAQAERDRALETMRQGRVRVLVATNVAARGLDLPELGLVVHSDLPENVESLTHRSGRTGRAGKKGRSLFLVSTGQRRKAERLFHAAKLKITFSTPPSLEDVTRHEHEALREEMMAAAAGPVGDEAQRITNELLSSCTAETLIGALIDRALKERPAGERVSPVSLDTSKPGRQTPMAAPGGPRTDSFMLYEVNLGAQDSAAANWLLPLICRRGAITRREVGAIRIARDRTYFEVASHVASEFIANASERDPRAPKVTIVAAEGPIPEFSHGSPPRHPMRMNNKPQHEGPRTGFRDKPAGAYGAKPTGAYGKPAGTYGAKPTGGFRDKPASDYGRSKPASDYGKPAGKKPPPRR